MSGSVGSLFFVVLLLPHLLFFSAVEADEVGAPANGKGRSLQRWEPSGVLSSFIPLRDGLVIVANRDNATIELVDVDRNLTLTTSPQLANPPGRMALDPRNDVVWVALNENQIAKVAPLSGAITYINTPYPSVDVAVGDQFVYVLCRSISSDSERIVSVLDRVSEVWVANVSVPIFSGAIATYRDEFFFTAMLGISGGVPLAKFSRVGSSTSWKQTLSGGSASNGNALAISPDGRHVVLASGGGNGNGYSIYDYDSNDLSRIYGSFLTQAYPTGAAFSPDGRYFATSNYQSYLVFSTASHTVVDKQPQPSLSITQTGLRISLDSKRFYAYHSGDIIPGAGFIEWFDL